MEIKLPNREVTEIPSTSDEVSGYFIVSTRWTMINDQNITFIRNKSLGYCYNIAWAGPMNKFDANKVNASNKATRVISYQAIRPFLGKLNDALVLPNSPEVRKLIGLDNAELQVAN